MFMNNMVARYIYGLVSIGVWAVISGIANDTFKQITMDVGLFTAFNIKNWINSIKETLFSVFGSQDTGNVVYAEVA